MKMKKKKIEKSAWLLERSRLFAEYAEREPNICDRVGVRLENKKWGWINAYFSINGEEKNLIELSNVYEPFVDIKKWLENIVKNEKEYKHIVSMVEINCEGYGAALYYEPMLTLNNNWNGCEPWICLDTGIFYIFDSADNKVWADAICDTRDFVKSIYESIINFAKEMQQDDGFIDDWVWDAYNNEMGPYNGDEPELKELFLKKVKSEEIEDYIKNGKEPEWIPIRLNDKNL